MLLNQRYFTSRAPTNTLLLLLLLVQLLATCLLNLWHTPAPHCGAACTCLTPEQAPSFHAALAAAAAGGLCELDMLFMEHHDPKMRSADGIKMKLKDMEKLFERLRSARPGCKVNITDLDDESYVNGRLVPLPRWHETPEQQAKGYP